MKSLNKLVAISCIALLFSGSVTCSSFSGSGLATPSKPAGTGGVPPTTSKKPAPSTPDTMKTIDHYFKSNKFHLEDGVTLGIIDKGGKTYTPKQFIDWLHNASDAHTDDNPSIDTYIANKKVSFTEKFDLPKNQRNYLINQYFVPFVTTNLDDLILNKGVLEFEPTPGPNKGDKHDPETPRKKETLDEPVKTDAKDTKKAEEIKQSSSHLWLGLGLVGTVIALYTYNSWNKSRDESASAA